MKRIHYAQSTFLTDDSVADALMDYASVLAIVDSADVVTCPGVDDAGVVRLYQLLIGPASQVMAVTTDEPFVEIGAAAAVVLLRDRAGARLPSSLEVGDAGTRPAESDAESTEH